MYLDTCLSIRLSVHRGGGAARSDGAGGYPRCPDRTTDGVLDTPRSVCLLHSCRRTFLLPPAYVVQREGNSFTLLVCSHPGGYPYPIMLCNISQNAMGQPGGYPYPIMLCNISQNAMGQLGGYPGLGGVPWMGGVSWPGGVPWPGRVPWSGTPPPQPGQDGGVPCPGGVPR